MRKPKIYPEGEKLVPEARAYCKEKGLRDPRQAFRLHRNGAKERDIAFEMTFDEWWTTWKDHFHMRGRGTNELCMARKGDEGPYKLGNVYLTTKLGNSIDYHDPRRAEKQAKKEREGRYWGKDRKNIDIRSHISYKSHCNPKKFVPV